MKISYSFQEAEESAYENRSKLENAVYSSKSKDQQSKSSLQGINCKKPNYSNKSEFKSTRNTDENSTSRKELKNTK